MPTAKIIRSSVNTYRAVLETTNTQNSNAIFFLTRAPHVGTEPSTERSGLEGNAA